MHTYTCSCIRTRVNICVRMCVYIIHINIVQKRHMNGTRCMYACPYTCVRVCVCVFVCVCILHSYTTVWVWAPAGAFNKITRIHTYPCAHMCMCMLVYTAGMYEWGASADCLLVSCPGTSICLATRSAHFHWACLTRSRCFGG